MARSLPKGEEPWQTFTVRVTAVRGQALIYAAVELSFVTGVVGPHHGRPRPLWQGVVGRRDPLERLEPERAARLAAQALENAFPALW